jgi:hypothetical protein
MTAPEARKSAFLPVLAYLAKSLVSEGIHHCPAAANQPKAVGGWARYRIDAGLPAG